MGLPSCSAWLRPVRRGANLTFARGDLHSTLSIWTDRYDRSVFGWMVVAYDAALRDQMRSIGGMGTQIVQPTPSGEAHMNNVPPGRCLLSLAGGCVAGQWALAGKAASRTSECPAPPFRAPAPQRLRKQRPDELPLRIEQFMPMYHQGMTHQPRSREGRPSGVDSTGRKGVPGEERCSLPA
jgi:hypothetical protein